MIGEQTLVFDEEDEGMIERTRDWIIDQISMVESKLSRSKNKSHPYF